MNISPASLPPQYSPRFGAVKKSAIELATKDIVHETMFAPGAFESAQFNIEKLDHIKQLVIGQKDNPYFDIYGDGNTFSVVKRNNTHMKSAKNAISSFDEACQIASDFAEKYKLKLEFDEKLREIFGMCEDR